MPDLSPFSSGLLGGAGQIPRCRARGGGGAGGPLSTRRRPPPGHDGPLTTDLAVLGPRDAARVLLVNAGTHGVEAFAGSAIEIGFLAGGPALPATCVSSWSTPSTRTASPGCAA